MEVKGKLALNIGHTKAGITVLDKTIDIIKLETPLCNFGVESFSFDRGKNSISTQQLDFSLNQHVNTEYPNCS